MQSVMFSSTLQVLECYRDSPTSSTYSKSEYGINLQDSPRSAMPVYESKAFNDYHRPPSSGTSSFPTSAEPSPSNSPASSQTSAFSDSSFPNTPGQHKEIRRRRSPTDTEPRPKDLKLLSSNVRFNRNDFAAAASNSEWEKPLPEPSPVPPPPPPKNVLRDAISRNLIQASDENIMGNKGSKESSHFGMRKDSIPYRGKTPATEIADSPPSKSTTGLRSPPSLKLIVPQNEAPYSLPSRVDSIPKSTQSGPNPNFPNPKQGLRRPTHRKNASISSNLDKELPAKPPPEPLPPTPKIEKELPDIKEAQRVFQESDLSKDMTFRTHTRGKSNTALNILKSLSPGPARNKPPVSPDSKSPTPPAIPTFPALRDIDASPAPSASQPSTIRRKTPPTKGTTPLPAKQPWHDRTHSQGSVVSDLTTASFATTAFTKPQPPTMPVPLLKVEEPSPIQPFQFPTELDENGNFMIPQKRFPVPPMPLTHIHYDCYTKHRPLTPSKNILAAVLCMVCKEDSDQMWKCGWCCLRICGSCRQALGNKRGDLRRLVEEGRGPHVDGSRKQPGVNPAPGPGFVPRSRPTWGSGSNVGEPTASGRPKVMI